MATTNPALTTSWAKIVVLGNNFLLTLPFTNASRIEVAVQDTDVAPTVQGHVMRGRRGDTLTRTQLGPGHVYARAIDGAATVTLSSWTP